MVDEKSTPPWLAEDEPLDEDQSRIQVSAVLTMLDEMFQRTDAEAVRQDGARVLELGCGGGRVLIPLAAAGHHITGIDFNEVALERCGSRAHAYRSRVNLQLGNFLTDEWPAASEDRDSYDAILLLGNTLMTMTDLDDAITLFSRVAQRLSSTGSFLIDDIPGCFWPELTEGNWQSGLSDDGSMQLVWHPRDTLFTIRIGDDVDVDCWELKPGDRLFRLWTHSLLIGVVRAAGLSEPHVSEESILISMHRR